MIVIVIIYSIINIFYHVVYRIQIIFTGAAKRPVQPPGGCSDVRASVYRYPYFLPFFMSSVMLMMRASASATTIDDHMPFRSNITGRARTMMI